MKANEYTISPNLKPVHMDFDSSDVALLEGGEHVQHRVEAAPPETQKLKSFREFSENKLNVLQQLEHTHRERTRMMNGQIGG